MENMKIEPSSEATRRCNCCGKELPYKAFSKRGFGVDAVCKDCMKVKRKEKKDKEKQLEELQARLEEAEKKRLSEFTPRQLMEELVRRGYGGHLTFTRIETIDLSKI